VADARAAERHGIGRIGCSRSGAKFARARGMIPQWRLA
jgi:hypothetical protein